MKVRIEELLEKYWEAETSQSEEMELRRLILEAEDYEQEKALFKGLDQFKAEKPKNLRIPKAKNRKQNPHWLSWAASITILIGSFWGWRVYEQKQAEQKAFEEVMQAFALIQSNLSKAKDQLAPLNDLKYLNTTNQLFQLDQNPNQ
jgi:hypothetical protein